MNNGLGNLDDLFQSAQDDGLTDDALDLFIANLNGPTMATAVGTPLDQLATNEVTLAMNIVDMSGSMTPHADALIQAYNQDYLAVMAGSTAVDDILVSTILFDDKVTLLHGYVALDDAPKLSPKTYRPGGTTALYDAVAGGLTNTALYSQQLRQSGVMVRCLILVYSDGDDNASRQTAKAVRRAAQELLDQEMYTLVYVGFLPDGQKPPVGFPGTTGASPLQKIAADIGFPQALSAGMDQSELRRLFRMVSQTAVQVSQGSMAQPIFA